MHVDVSLQLAQLAMSVLTGFALGLGYDALRALRREVRKNAALDALFCAVLLLALFTLGMDIGQGGLHIFMFCAAAAGFAAYMALLSPVILPVFARLTGFTAKFFSPLRKFIKKLADTVKKCFSKAFNWYTMKKQSSKRRKAEQDEKIDDDHRSGIDDACRICYSEPGEPQARPRRRNGADKRSAGGDPAGTNR